MSYRTRNALKHTDYTVACICPLGIELAPVEAMLDESHDSLPTKQDRNAYTLGKIGDHNIVIAVMPEIGNDAAATVATQLLNDFPSVRFSLLVGIGGGVPGEDGEDDVRLGDVVVSQPTQTYGGVVQYDLGKRLANGHFERIGQLNKPPEILSTNVRKLQAQHLRSGNRVTELVSDMIARYPRMKEQYSHPGSTQDLLFASSYTHPAGSTCQGCDHTQLVPRTSRPDTDPRIHYGTVGSATSVVKDAIVRDALRRDFRLICVEMEAAGLMKNFQCLVIRGICDYADSHKNKQWQPYAAVAAAAYMKELLLAIPASQPSEATSASALNQLAFRLGIHLDGAHLMDSHFFVGRDAEVAKLESLLKPWERCSEQRRVVIGGIGGIGKTQLSIEYARRHRHTYDSIFWLNVASEATLKDSLRVLAQFILTAEEFETCNDQHYSQRVRRWLSEAGNCQWLLILDNYDEPEQFDINDYFPYTSHGSIIITTRLPEQVIGDHIILSALHDTEDGLKILEYRSGRAGLEHDPDARRLAERLQGLPLALATAGQYLKKNTLSCARYLEVYETRWNINPRRPIQLPEYKNRTLYTTWGLSFNRLEQEDLVVARMLKILAYFDNQSIWYDLLRSGVKSDSPAWLQDVLADELVFASTMAILVDYCFLEIREITASYGMHSCVHDWALAELNSSDDKESYWFAFDCVSNLVVCQDWVDWSELRERRYAPLVPHATRLVQPRFIQSLHLGKMFGTRFMEAKRLSSLLREHNRFAPAERACNLILQYAESTYGRNDVTTLWAINDLGNLYYHFGRYDDARRMYDRILACMTEVDDTLLFCTFNNLGLLHYRQGRFEKAENMYQLVLTSNIYEEDMLHDTIYNLGLLYRVQQRLDKATEAFERVLKFRKQSLGKNHIKTLRTLGTLGDLYCDQGNVNRGEVLLKQSLIGLTKILGQLDITTLSYLNRLISLYVREGRLSEAKQLYDLEFSDFERALNFSEPLPLEIALKLSYTLSMRTRIESAALGTAPIEALQLARLAYEHGGSDPAFYEWLGRPLLILGDEVNAVNAFRHSLVRDEVTSVWVFNRIVCDGCDRQTNTATGRNVCRKCIDIDLCDECMTKYATGGLAPKTSCTGHSFFRIDIPDESELERWIAMPPDKSWITDMLKQYDSR